MKRLEINDIKDCSFQVLCRIDEVCRKHGIAYSLTGGTLIGAIRHQGFIPWDDDIDIMMPRPDYDRFVEIVRTGDYGFDLHCQEMDGNAYWYPFTKACHRDTVLKESAVRETGLSLGVYVDVFPVDGAGNTAAGAKLRTMVFTFLHGLRLTANWTCYRRSKLRKWYYEPVRFICYLLGKLIGVRALDKMIDRFLRARSFSKSTYAGRLVGDYGSREVMPANIFHSYTEVAFEGKQFAAITEYDRFLRALYGDYMQLPPEEKQKTHHEFEAYWVK